MALTHALALAGSAAAYYSAAAVAHADYRTVARERSPWPAADRALAMALTDYHRAWVADWKSHEAWLAAHPYTRAKRPRAKRPRKPVR